MRQGYTTSFRKNSQSYLITDFIFSPPFQSIMSWSNESSDRQIKVSASSRTLGNRVMDPITHVLITCICIDTKPSTILGGLVADAPFYCAYPPWLFVTKQLGPALATNTWPEPPAWMKTAHHIFHSFPVLGLLALLHHIIWKRWSSASLFAWCLHVLIDLPTHSRRQWAPQFLWPLSDVTIDGVSWAELLFAKVATAKGKQ